MKTNAGSAKIVWPEGLSNLKITDTQIDLQSLAVIASLRFRFYGIERERARLNRCQSSLGCSNPTETRRR